jgi:hypothetical protein
MLIGRGIPHPEATGFVDTCEIDNPRMADQVLTLFRYEQQKPVWASLQTRHKGSDVDTLCIGPEVVDAHLLRVRQLRAKRSNLHGTSGFYCQRLDLWARGHELGPVPGREDMASALRSPGMPALPSSVSICKPYSRNAPGGMFVAGTVVPLRNQIG